MLGMKVPRHNLAERRRLLGLTQAELSRLARVSLATLQNVEADRANPSLDLLSRILAHLGLQVEYAPRAADWDLLCSLGLPLMAEAPGSARPSGDLLVAQLRLAALELTQVEQCPDAPRKLEAVQALVAALKSHFPTFFEFTVAKSPLLGALVPRDMSGRLIRLSRAARPRLAEYL